MKKTEKIIVLRDKKVTKTITIQWLAHQTGQMKFEKLHICR